MSKWLKGFLYTCFALCAMLLICVGPIDRTPLQEKSHYTAMEAMMDTLLLASYPPTQKLSAAWSKISITPDYTMPMAGYRPRDTFESVHDSLYARVIMLDNGTLTCYLISVDLLLFPPSLKNEIIKQVAIPSHAPFLYFSATHTHNGVGGWQNNVIGEMTMGDYHETWVQSTAQKIAHEIIRLKDDAKPAQLSFWEANASEYVENRLVANAPSDGLLRGFTCTRSDSSQAYLITYSAHPTNINSASTTLSGDYPAALIDSLSQHNNSFGMFMAGMVGSHRLAGVEGQDYVRIGNAAGALRKKVMNGNVSQAEDSIHIRASHIPISFGASQLRLSKNWKVRDWLFSWLVNPLEGELTYLELNNMVFIGTPVDFSGEIYITQQLAQQAASKQKKLIITSFNGDYAGYITEDLHYDEIDKEEVRVMNWVGPYYGAYFAEMLKRLLEK